ncbi:MAG: serine/threonine-protein kinase [Acidimicrobiales bacterium]
MTADPDLLASLPGYELGDQLGQGAYATVIAARHRRLQRDVAIKQLTAAPGTTIADRKRFEEEARVLARLHHPHIVSVYDFVERGSLLLIIMERLTGGTVRERVEVGGLSPQSACAIVIATCAALNYAHHRGVLHRDIKPENLMFSADGLLKVTDFGIAKVIEGLAAVVTQPGQLLGTPAYMAPEQIDRRPLGRTVDVYAAGSVLYELLSGTLPYDVTPDRNYLLYQHVYDDPRPLRDVAPDVPEPFAVVAHRAIARAPDQRYPTAESFGKAIAKAATAVWGPGWLSATGGILARSTSEAGRPADVDDTLVRPSQRVPVAGAPVPTPDRQIDLPVFRPRRRRRRRAIAIAAVAVVVVASAAYALSRLDRGPASGGEADVPSLTILDATVSLEPVAGVLHCPQGRAVYSASVTTNGAAGMLTYQWTRPDASKGEVATVVLSEGQRSITTSLEFTFTGQGNAGGVAKLEVVAPNQLSASAPNVAYVCP